MPGIEFLLNGRRVWAEGLPPHTTLLDFVRSQGLTGAKEGCAEGECGACTVIMVRPHGTANGTGSAYVPVNSCLLFLSMAAGQEVYTVESLADSQRLLQPQQELADRGGSQCGYCTPGFVMSLFAEQYRPGRQGACDVHALSGNLCRCTGYRPIRDAALAVGPAPAGAWLDRLAQSAPPMDRASSEAFSRPASVSECLEIMAERPHARLIAGGTDLAVESNLRGKRFAHLISVEALAELRICRESAHQLELGAGLTLAELERVAGLPPVFHQWFPLFASPLIRNRATLGGNLATASPIGDAAPLLLALDAQVRIAGPQGGRTIALANFFLDYRRTALQAGELLVSIILPKPFPALTRFYKAAKRRMDDISTVAACFSLDLDSAHRAARVRIAFGGVAPVPMRATDAERAMEGAIWNANAIRRAQDAIGRTLRPMTDHRGSSAYRLALARNLLEKFAA
jgi:xanthine dehydrogenase small subunit